MKVKVLGTGTSTGVPMPGCRCEVCSSDNPRNKRLRCSIYIECNNGAGILVDSTPDLRQQALTYNISNVDVVLYTHAHADHTFGIDDLRCFNFLRGGSLPVYADDPTSADLKHKFDYIFSPRKNYEGGSPPRLVLNNIVHYQSFEICDLEILPLTVMHGSAESLAFRIGSFAYLTDCSAIPERTRKQLMDLDVLIIDGLRDRPHKTHFTQAQAVEEIERLKPKKSFLTHISHEIEHEEANQKLKEMTSLDVEIAYDGLEFNLS